MKSKLGARDKLMIRAGCVFGQMALGDSSASFRQAAIADLMREAKRIGLKPQIIEDAMNEVFDGVEDEIQNVSEWKEWSR